MIYQKVLSERIVICSSIFDMWLLSDIYPYESMGMLQYLSSIAIQITTHTSGLYKDASHGSLILGILHSILPTILPTRTIRAIAAVGTALRWFGPIKKHRG